jgi:hypothetical protein
MKQKASNLKEGGAYMDEARNTSLPSRGTGEEDGSTGFQSFNSATQRVRGAESIASLSNSMAHHARTLVGQFNCTGMNDRMGPILATEMAEGREDGRSAQRHGDQEWRDRRPNLDSAAAKKAFAAQPRNGSKTYQNFPQAHRVVDV